MQEGVEPVKFPLQVLLPFGSIIVGGGIAIAIGLINLELADMFSHTEPVIFGSVLLVVIMAGAAFLSSKYPDPPDADELQSHH